MASIYIIRGRDSGQHFAIRGINATIGRESSNQIQLRDTEVSRQHARIVRTGKSQFDIIDNGSSNGTYVNSRQVRSQTLKSGDRIQVGRTLLIFTGGPEPHSTEAVDAVEIVGHEEPNDLSQIRSSLVSHGALTPHAVPGPDVSDRDAPDRNDSNLSSRKGPTPIETTAADNLEIVYKVSQAIHRTIDLDELLRHVLELIFQWIQCDRACILMLDDISGQLAPICSLDRKRLEGNKLNAQPKPLRISRTILEHVVNAKEGVVTSNAQDDSRWRNAESVAKLGIREAICVPMLGRYGLVGAIYVDTSMSAGVFAEQAALSCYDEQHLKLMVAIAGQAALAIEDTQFYRAMVQSERLAAMGQAIASLSHHVKNILQGISGGNYLVEDGLDKADLDVVFKGWGIVKRNQLRISNLVMDMLSFSKDREPQLEYRDLREVIDDVVSLMQVKADEARVQMKWQRPDNILQVDMECEAMHRALLNVLSNAIDACTDDLPDGRVGLVSIEASIQENLVSVNISDNAAGISPEELQRIFVPFESNKGAKGTGLGLPVSQKILREHGGDITVDSRLNEGSTFRLAWPARQQIEVPPTQPG